MLSKKKDVEFMENNFHMLEIFFILAYNQVK